MPLRSAIKCSNRRELGCFFKVPLSRRTAENKICVIHKIPSYDHYVYLFIYLFICLFIGLFIYMETSLIRLYFLWTKLKWTALLLRVCRRLLPAVSVCYGDSCRS
jgi:hypothetical protein